MWNTVYWKNKRQISSVLLPVEFALNVVYVVNHLIIVLKLPQGRASWGCGFKHKPAHTKKFQNGYTIVTLDIRPPYPLLILSSNKSYQLEYLVMPQWPFDRIAKLKYRPWSICWLRGSMILVCTVCSGISVRMFSIWYIGQAMRKRVWTYSDFLAKECAQYWLTA